MESFSNRGHKTLQSTAKLSLLLLAVNNVLALIGFWRDYCTPKIVLHAIMEQMYLSTQRCDLKKNSKKGYENNKQQLLNSKHT